MIRAPERFARYLLDEPYHPRSNKHSNALMGFLLEDLLEECLAFRRQAGAGRLAYELNKRVRVGADEWNVDLVVGPPAAAPGPAPRGTAILRAQPSTFRLTCEAKAIMTEHRKAQHNRQRDLNALHQFMHRYDQNTIVAAVTVVNIAGRFKSPLRHDVTQHKDPVALARNAIDLLRTIPVRTHPSNGLGLEANAVIVVDYDNSGDAPTSVIHTASPAPPPGDPLNWESFLRRICDLYTQRWGAS
jgi:hypothetical protein